MKIFPQEVYLHGLGKFPDYCYSVDISWSPSGVGKTYVVTGGADSVARVWTVNEKSFQLEIHSELTGHQLGVNCVRFAPDGTNTIATASDDGKVCIWKQQLLDLSNPTAEHRWVQGRVLNVLDEVVGIAWSPCGTMIVAAVQREMSHVFSVQTGRLLARLDGHTNRVTGVTWDPLNQLIVSQSSDRTCRIYAKKKNGSWYPKALLKDVDDTACEALATAQIATVSDDPIGDLLKDPAELINTTVQKKSVTNKWKLFISESHYPNDPTAHFFRRPDFSPDGSMIVVPGGLSDAGDSGVSFVTHLFARRSLSTGQAPTATFTTPCAPSMAVRFHPRPFVASEADVAPFYVFAVTTVSSFYVLRSDRGKPIAFATDLHCTAIVDASWSSDAKILALSSTDGYVTLIRFSEGELGGVPDWSGFVPTAVASDKATPADVPQTGENENSEMTRHENLPAEMGKGEKRRITPIIVTKE